MIDGEIGTREMKYYQTLADLTPEDRKSLQNVIANCVRNIERTDIQVGLIYGKVQSGKTNALIACIARTNDRGFKLFVILTSDNVSLYTQTLDRIRNGLPTLYVLGIDDLKNFDEIIGRTSAAMNRAGVVLVSTKNATNLRMLQNFLGKLDVNNAKTLVFDDEADYGSLNSKVNSKEADQQSAIHRLIVSLQGMFKETKFIQVTATPQAVFLQRQGGGFRPEFVVQIEPGKGYIGGDELFDIDSHEVLKNIQRYVDPKEIEAIRSRADYRQSGLEEIPDGIRRAVSSFLIGASCKTALGSENQNFSMLCHISSKIAAHKSLLSLINRYIEIISENVDDKTKKYHQGVVDDLINAYKDISTTLSSKVEWSDVFLDVCNKISSTHVQIVVSGRGKQNPSYTAPYNILIGGDRLGRGLTIKNLIVTYYVRKSGAPKVDTMLQHSRAYGYRKNDLDVMRFFSTEDIFRVYYDVYTSDKEEWEYFSNNHGDHTQYPVILSFKENGRIRATRNEVVPLVNNLRYFPGKAYIMYDATADKTAEIDRLLKEYSDDRKDPLRVDFALIEQLVGLTTTGSPEQKWNPEALKKIIANMGELSNSGQGEQGEGGHIVTPYLVVRRNRDEKKGYRAILSSDDNGIKIDDGLILFMYRLTGSKEIGWDGVPVWVPVIRFPKGNAYYFTVDYEVSRRENHTADE